MIRGYPDRPSAAPGETLSLHVSTDQPSFRIAFYRQGTTLAPVTSPALVGPNGEQDPQNVMPSFPAVDGRFDVDWGWPGYSFTVPADWNSGAYIAMLIAIDTAGVEHLPDTSTADGDAAKALFVVRNDLGSPRPVLYKLSLTTYHAYNFAGEGSLYETDTKTGNPAGFKVTMLRPGGGTGFSGGVRDFPDVYDMLSRRNTFAHWDPPFIAWLESNGYEVDYCTDLDIHEDTSLSMLSRYQLLLSVGHDEYWSADMRTNVDAFIRNGGNVAFFSGNTCWWRISFVDPKPEPNNPAVTHMTAFTCNKANYADRWPELGQPGNSLVGVGLSDSISKSDGYREAVGYTVQQANHWVYAGTGLTNGDVFGTDQRFPLLGYETDGKGVGTPSSFTVLGASQIDTTLQSPLDWGTNGAGQATMGIYTNGGTVFTAATIDWVKVLAGCMDPYIERITRNVVDRLSGTSGTPVDLPGCAGGDWPTDVTGVWRINANGKHGTLTLNPSFRVPLEGILVYDDANGRIDPVIGSWNHLTGQISFISGIPSGHDPCDLDERTFYPDSLCRTVFTFGGSIEPLFCQLGMQLVGSFTRSDVYLNVQPHVFPWSAFRARASAIAEELEGWIVCRNDQIWPDNLIVQLIPQGDPGPFDRVLQEAVTGSLSDESVSWIHQFGQQIAQSALRSLEEGAAVYVGVRALPLQSSQTAVAIDIMRQSEWPAVNVRGGFQGAYLVTDLSSDQCLVIGLWATEAASHELETRGFDLAKGGRLTSLLTGSQNPTIAALPGWAVHEISAQR